MHSGMFMQKLNPKSVRRQESALVTAQQSLDLAKNNKDGDFGYVKLNEDLIKSLK